jgi:aryl-alcohol dehydrogenase-like predicted oxidoreductase
MRTGLVRGIAEPVVRCVLGTSGIRGERGYRLLDEFIARGGNCLDTARVYGGGTAERTVGKWLRRAAPERVLILAKGAHPPNCTPSTIADELSVTLDLLGVSTVDLYMLHRDNRDVPVVEFIDALDREVAAGRMRAYGASNWSQERLAEANRYAVTKRSAGMVALSNHFSLADPIEPLYPGCETVPVAYRSFLERTDIALFPWSSQARGFFADVDPAKLDPNTWRCWGAEVNYARRTRARQLAEQLGTRPINVALAYVLAQPFLTFPIIGPQSPAELVTAMDGLETELDPQQLRWLAFGDSEPDRCLTAPRAS